MDVAGVRSGERYGTSDRNVLVSPLVRFFVETLIRVLRGTPGSNSLLLTSWFRSPQRNRAVGGSPESQHLFGLAVDLVGPTETLKMVQTAANRVGLIAVDEIATKGHLHIQLFPKGFLRSRGVRFPQ